MSANNIFKLFSCSVLALGVLLGASQANAQQNKNGAIFSEGGCPNCTAQRKSDRPVRIVDGTKKRSCTNCPTPEFTTKNYVYTQPRYKASQRRCCDMATFALTDVNFKLNGENGYSPYAGQKVGNYRFRITGCRRATKKAILNQGRILQQHMAFNDVFRKAADRCYKVMDIPNVCLANNDVALPEYILTAEINDFFMNVCDEYDWDKAQSANRRDGSAEMTVTWRLMDLGRSKVYWKGITTGYADLDDGVFEGEVRLAEEAFADATSRLSSLPGFEAQLKQHMSPEQMALGREALVAYDARVNPGKCGQPQQYNTPCGQPSCPLMMQPVQMMQPMQPMCPCAMQQPCVCTQPVCTCPMVSCPCAVQIPQKPKVEEFVDVKTKKKIIEQKIITKTRVETPAPVCQQVCQPVCPQPTCQVQCTKTCQPSKCRRVCTEVCDESTGKCTRSCREDCSQQQEKKVEVVSYVPAVQEPVVQTGGVTETHRVYENCIDEQGYVVTEGNCAKEPWVEVEPASIPCVEDRAPYTELSPENMLKIRGDVVDITHTRGKNGNGLLVANSYVLTTADMVNKFENGYTVKTIKGTTLKAKAVRYNTAKNTAVLRLDRPLIYSPLAFATKLPSIDQEGFIALGQESGKNYMDDNGKIYGYRNSETSGTEVIVDTLVNTVSRGSVLIDKLGTVNGISNGAQQTKDGMDVFLPADTALKSVGLTICPKKPITEQIKQETKAPEVMPAPKRK